MAKSLTRKVVLALHWVASPLSKAKMTGRPQRQGPKSGSHGKNGFPGKNLKNLGKKKHQLLHQNHVPAVTGQRSPKEKVQFFQMINSHLMAI